MRRSFIFGHGAGGSHWKLFAQGRRGSVSGDLHLAFDLVFSGRLAGVAEDELLLGKIDVRGGFYLLRHGERGVVHGVGVLRFDFDFARHRPAGEVEIDRAGCDVHCGLLRRRRTGSGLGSRRFLCCDGGSRLRDRRRTALRRLSGRRRLALARLGHFHGERRFGYAGVFLSHLAAIAAELVDLDFLAGLDLHRAAGKDLAVVVRARILILESRGGELRPISEDLFGDRHDAAVRAIEVIDSHSHRTVRDNREIGRLLSLVALTGLRDGLGAAAAGRRRGGASGRDDIVAPVSVRNGSVLLGHRAGSLGDVGDSHRSARRQRESGFLRRRPCRIATDVIDGESRGRHEVRRRVYVLDDGEFAGRFSGLVLCGRRGTVPGSRLRSSDRGRRGRRFRGSFGLGGRRRPCGCDGPCAGGGL